jgi:hypothetical protein
MRPACFPASGDNVPTAAVILAVEAVLADGAGKMVSDGADLDGIQVLVAEDSFFVALDLESTLTGWGCRVLGPVASVASGLVLLRRSAPISPFSMSSCRTAGSRRWPRYWPAGVCRTCW